MAKGELVIGSDANAARQTFANAVTYMGGSVVSMNKSRPMEFRVSRSGNLGGYGAPYHGIATFIQIGPSQTKILIEINPKAWFTGVTVAGALAVIMLGAAMTQDEETAMTITVILVPVVAIMLYLYYGPWRKQVIDKLQDGVHGTVPAYEMAHQATAASSAPAGAVPTASATGSSIADQIRQLKELKDQDLISLEEFNSKKEELLKRL